MTNLIDSVSVQSPSGHLVPFTFQEADIRPWLLSKYVQHHFDDPSYRGDKIFRAIQLRARSHWIERKDLFLAERYDQCIFLINQYQELEKTLDVLRQQTDLSPESTISREKMVRELLEIRHHLLSLAFWEMTLFANSTNEESRKEYYTALDFDPSHLGGLSQKEQKKARVSKKECHTIYREVRQGMKEVHHIAIAWKDYFQDALKGDERTIEDANFFSMQNEEYAQKVVSWMELFFEAEKLSKQFYEKENFSDFQDDASTLERIGRGKIADEILLLRELLRQKQEDLNAYAAIAGRLKMSLTPEKIQELMLFFENSCDHALIYRQPIEKSLEMLSQLIQGDPKVYCDRASMLLCRYLDDQDFVGAIHFIQQWMATLPEQAESHYVMHAVGVFLQCEEIPETAFIKFQHSLEDWVAKRPDLQFNPEKSQEFSEAANLLLARGVIRFHRGDLSLEALNLYQQSSLIAPENPTWKLLQAQFYLSIADWSEARKCLEGLGECSDSLFLAIAHYQYHTYSLRADLIIPCANKVIDCAIRHALPGSWTESGLLGAKVVLEKSVLIKPYLIQQAMGEAGGLIPVSFIDIKTTISLQVTAGAISFLGNQFFTSYLAKQRLQLGVSLLHRFTPIFVGRSLMDSGSHFSMVDAVATTVFQFALYHTRGDGHTMQAVWMTAEGTVSSLTTTWTVYQTAKASGIVPRLIKRGSLRVGGDALFASANVQYIAGYATPFLGVVLATYLTGCKVFYDYPYLRTAATLQDVGRLSSERKEQEAKALLAAAKERWRLFSHASAIDGYEVCLEFFLKARTLSPKDQKWLNEIAPQLKKTLKALGETEHYACLHQSLALELILAYFATEQDSEAQALIRNEPIHSPLHGQLVQYIVTQATEKDEVFLRRIEPCFHITEYQRVIALFRDFLIHKANHPSLLQVADSPVEGAKKWEELLDRLIQATAFNSTLRSLHEMWQQEQFLFYLRTHQEKAAYNSLLDGFLLDSDRNVRSLFALIQEVHSLRLKGNLQAAKSLLTRAHEVASILYSSSIEYVEQKAFLLFGKPFTLMSEQLLAAYQNLIDQEDGTLELKLQAMGSVCIAASSIRGGEWLNFQMQMEEITLLLKHQKFFGAAELFSFFQFSVSSQEKLLEQILLKAIDLGNKEGDEEALFFLTSVHQSFTTLVSRSLIAQLAELLRPMPIEKNARDSWFANADALVNSMQQNPSLQKVYQAVKFLRFFQYVKNEAFSQAELVLDASIASLVHGIAIYNISYKIQYAFRQGDIERAEQLAQSALKAFSDPCYATILSECLLLEYLESQDAELQKKGKNLLIKQERQLDQLIELYKERPELARLIHPLQKRKLLLYVLEGNLSQAAAIVQGFAPFFDQIVDEKWREMLQKYLLQMLVAQAISLKREPLDYFAILFGVDQHPVLQACTAFLSLFREISSLEHIEQGIGAAQQLTQTLEVEKIPCPSWIQEIRVSLHFNAGMEYRELNHFHKAYQELVFAEELLLHAVVNPQLLTFVRQQKEQISKFLS